MTVSARVLTASLSIAAAGLLLSGCTQREVPVAEPVDGVRCSTAAHSGAVDPGGAVPGVAGPGAGGGAPGRIPKGFTPVAVYTCDEMGSFEDEAGLWSATVQRRLEGELGPLLAGFRVGDDWRWLGPCSAIGTIVPEVWLVDASGSAIRVAYPVDGCGQPKAEAITAALDRLTVVEETYLDARLQESSAALTAGCATRGEVLRIAALDDVGAPESAPESTPESAPESAPESTPESDPAGDPRALPDTMTLTPDPAQVAGMRVCIYDTDPAPTDSAPTAEGGPVGLPRSGTFTEGRQLSREDALTILANAAHGVTAPGTCTAATERYALLLPLDGSGRGLGLPIQIELDHCTRLGTARGVALAGAAVLDLIRG